jgi:DNA-directed RNA polymerase specialized sigma24 family protein
MRSVPSPDAEAGHGWKWLAREFPETKWTALKQMTDGGDEPGDGAPAAEKFCRAYWYPLYAFLRRKGYRAEEAQDHIQSFFAGAMQNGCLATADAAKGRLRNYLMTLVARHAAARHAKSNALKRGGGIDHIPFDWAGAEACFLNHGHQSSSPEDACRRALAAQLVQTSLDDLRETYAASGRTELFAALLPSLEGPLQDDTYQQVAARLGLRNGAVRMAALRLRDRFKQRLRIRAAAVLSLQDGPQLDREILHLLCADAFPGGV